MIKILMLAVALAVSTNAFAQGRQESYEQRVQSLLQESRYADAKAVCEEWRAAKPEDVQGIDNCVLDVSTKEYEDTTRAYNDFTSSAEKLLKSTSLNEYDYLEQGIVSDENGQPSQAIAAYNKALEINPNFSDAYNSRGIAYSNLGIADQALLDFNKAIELDPNYPEAFLNRAFWYYENQDYNQAWDDVSKVESLGGDVPADFLEALRISSGREE